MGFLEGCKSVILYFFALFPPFGFNGLEQKPLVRGHFPVSHDDLIHHNSYPEFPAPSGPQDLYSDFNCTYPSLKDGWKACSTSHDRGCWLEGPDGQKFDIYTDYEKLWPEGITREVWYSFLPPRRMLIIISTTLR